MTIYIDNDCKCHVLNDGTMREFDVDYFDDKCDEFIEGYRYVPKGETWKREDGEVFTGPTFSPWKDSRELVKAQMQYEIEQLRIDLADADAALKELGVEV